MPQGSANSPSGQGTVSLKIIASRAWLEQFMAGAGDNKSLDLPGGARLRLVRRQAYRGTEDDIARFVFENLLTPMAINLAAAWLFEKLRVRRRDVASAQVGDDELTDMPDVEQFTITIERYERLSVSIARVRHGRQRPS